MISTVISAVGGAFGVILSNTYYENVIKPKVKDLVVKGRIILKDDKKTEEKKED